MERLWSEAKMAITIWDWIGIDWEQYWIGQDSIGQDRIGQDRIIQLVLCLIYVLGCFMFYKNVIWVSMIYMIYMICMICMICK